MAGLVSQVNQIRFAHTKTFSSFYIKQCMRCGNVALRNELSLCQSPEGRLGSGDARRRTLEWGCLDCLDSTPLWLYLLCPEWYRSSWPARCAPWCWGTSTCWGVLHPGCSSRRSASFVCQSAAFWTPMYKRQFDDAPNWNLWLVKCDEHRGQTWRPLGLDQRDEAAWCWERFATSADGGRSSPAWGEAGRFLRPGLLCLKKKEKKRRKANHPHSTAISPEVYRIIIKNHEESSSVNTRF